MGDQFATLIGAPNVAFEEVLPKLLICNLDLTFSGTESFKRNLKNPMRNSPSSYEEGLF